MVKLKNPLMSLKAQGRLSKLFSLAKRQGRHIIERRPIPTDAKSSSQLFSRLMFSKCIDLWHLLSDAEHQEWESAARPKHMTGYAWYISQCLRPNPGIYLPLIGGTMQGNIDMATNRILDLPDPTINQEADTRAARIAAILAHIAIAAAHHAVFTAATHTAIGDAAPHHTRYADAEAVTAAKTVKLDDFTTPDDNTDLNASAARHGLFKKLDGVVTHFLNGLGNWVAIAAGKSISTGSYTGNDGADRQITTGFKCSLLIVFRHDIDSFITFQTTKNMYLPDALYGGIDLARQDCLLHATDGFVVDRINANYNGAVYYYWAISE